MVWADAWKNLCFIEAGAPEGAMAVTEEDKMKCSKAPSSLWLQFFLYGLILLFIWWSEINFTL